jgi:thioredoxin reductase (NADPH)
MATQRPASPPTPAELAGADDETPDRDGAYPRLSDQQIQRLAGHGERRRTRAGDVLFEEGERGHPFFVVLDGRVAVVADRTGEARVIAVHGPRRFLGELGVLTGQAAFYSAVVREDGEVLAVPVERLRALVAQDAALGDLILRAYLLRRELLIGLGAGFRIIGSRFSPDTRRLRELAARNRLPHRWIDLEEDPGAEKLLRGLGVSPDETPVVLWHGQVLRNPSTSELARAIGLPAPDERVDVADVVVVGAGPAGLAAAVYGASEGLGTVALDAVATGGQAGTSSRIENYLGFPSGISGGELAERAVIQAEKFGARITVPAKATALERDDGHYVVRVGEQAITTRTVIIATGARYRRLPVPRLEDFEGAGVYYAATLMEAQLCAGDPVIVVGGGNSAGQATLFLTRYAADVHLLVRGDDLNRDMSRYLAARIERDPRVDLQLNTEVRELEGDDRLEAVISENVRTGERRRLAARDMFVFIGADPYTDWLAGTVALDADGFVLTGEAAARAQAADPARHEDVHDPSLLETTLPGVLAVGDVRSRSIKRVASAVGEGSMAVRLVHEHLAAAHHPSAPVAAVPQNGLQTARAPAPDPERGSQTNVSST